MTSFIEPPWGRETGRYFPRFLQGGGQRCLLNKVTYLDQHYIIFSSGVGWAWRNPTPQFSSLVLTWHLPPSSFFISAPPPSSLLGLPLPLPFPFSPPPPFFLLLFLFLLGEGTGQDLVFKSVLFKIQSQGFIHSTPTLISFYYGNWKNGK